MRGAPLTVQRLSGALWIGFRPLSRPREAGEGPDLDIADCGRRTIYNSIRKTAG